MQVVKRNGKKEPIDYNKIYEMVSLCCSGLENVSASDIIMSARIQFSDNITTENIQQLLIKAAAELISDQSPDYSLVAGRLLNTDLRKKVYNKYVPSSLLSIIEHNIKNKYYTEDILKYYTYEQIELLEKYINHEIDESYTYSSMQVWLDKYLVRNRYTNQYVETPQVALMLISMMGFAKYKKNRNKYIISFYKNLSSGKISLPTPIMAGIRTTLKQASSCVVGTTDDSLNSINSLANTVVKYASQNAGLGIEVGRIRAEGQPVRGGLATTTGLIPFIKYLRSALKSCSQGGLRSSSATLTLPVWHKQIQEVMVLKNDKGTPDTRVRDLDYSIGWNKYLIRRAINHQPISLFSPETVPGLYESFFYKDDEKFIELYEIAENNKLINKTVIEDGWVLLSSFLTERYETGRLYSFFADEVNRRSQFKKIVVQSNLCVTGDQRVVSNKGLLTVRELFESGEPLTLFDNEKPVSSTPMTLIEKDADVYKISLNNGLTHTITSYHKVLTDNGMIECKDLKIGDRIKFQTEKGLFGNNHMPKEAFLLGLYQADGTQNKDIVHIDLWENDFDLVEEVESNFEYLCKIYNTQINLLGREYNIPKFKDCIVNNSNVKKKRLSSKAFKKALNFEKGYVPQWIWESNEETQWQYVRGLYYADGTASIGRCNGLPLHLSITNTNKKFLEELQLLLLNLGINCSVSLFSEAGYKKLPNGVGGKKEYFCKDAYRLVCENKTDAKIFETNTKFLSRKNILLEDKEYRDNSKKYSRIKSIEYVGKEDVYCCTVDSEEHLWMCNGVITSNCQEITLPTEPITSPQTEDGLVSLCILAAVNLSHYTKQSDLEEPCDLLVRFLNELIDLQEYPIAAAKTATERYRPLGIGIIGLAHSLAKRDLYIPENKPAMYDFINEVGESLYYYSLKSTIEVAKETGACPGYKELTYSDGILNIDTYCKTVDEFAPYQYKLNWNNLREDLKNYGVKNAQLLACMPSEQSSIISNSTAGIDPVIDTITVTLNNGVNAARLSPDYTKLKDKYKKAYDFTPEDNIELIIKPMAVLQKYICQSISLNNYFDPKHFNDKKVKMEELLKIFLNASKYGIKTLYYSRTNVQSTNLEKSTSEPENNTIEETIESSCESCAI